MDEKTEFGGFELKKYDPGTGLEGEGAWLGVDTVEEENLDVFFERLEALVEEPGAATLKALAIGPWDFELFDVDSTEVVGCLASLAGKLPALEALFFGDIDQEVAEISWIQQSDLKELIDAFPNLKAFGVRGGHALRLSDLSHPRLEKLVIETGGMSSDTVLDIIKSHLPSLKTLELWMGSEEYGGDSTAADLEAILSGRLFPKLEWLGIRNCPYADELAEALVGSPIMDTLKVLDLSMGTMTDTGAQALLDAPATRRLTRLDLEDNYISEDMGERLSSLGIEVNTATWKEVDEHDGELYRYVSVGE